MDQAIQGNFINVGILISALYYIHFLIYNMKHMLLTFVFLDLHLRPLSMKDIRMMQMIPVDITISLQVQDPTPPTVEDQGEMVIT